VPTETDKTSGNTDEVTDSALANARVLLQTSLTEVQATVRGYDTKAQFVGVGYIFALSVVGRVGNLIPVGSTFGLAGLFMAWGVVVTPILGFGYLLRPTRKSAARLEPSKRDGIQLALYIDPSQKSSVSSIRKAAMDADLIDELSFELLMVSSLRENKSRWFLRGLYASAV